MNDTPSRPSTERETAPVALHGADTEHDRRVRAHLTELAAERGTSTHALLNELNAALSAGQAPPLPAQGTPAASAASASTEENTPASAAPQAVPADSRPARGRIVGQRPADDTWGVTSVEVNGPPRARRTVCGGAEPCPWRRDAPQGQFPAQAFRLSAPTSYDQSTRRFACHSHDPHDPYLCAGWLRRGAADNPAVRAQIAVGLLQQPSLPPGVELYESYREMAVANGVAPDDPALAPCRGDGPLWPSSVGEEEGMIPLSEFFADTQGGTGP